MSFGKMNTEISIKKLAVKKDAEGFQTNTEKLIATVRAYKEERRGTERWANLAAFSTASSLFRFRTIPLIKITPKHFIYCDGIKHNILSVNEHGRGQYLEVLAEKVEGSVK